MECINKTILECKGKHFICKNFAQLFANSANATGMLESLKNAYANEELDLNKERTNIINNLKLIKKTLENNLFDSEKGK